MISKQHCIISTYFTLAQYTYFPYGNVSPQALLSLFLGRNKDKPRATADDDGDEKLILFDTSASEDKDQPEEQPDQVKEDDLDSKFPSNEEDLLGILSGPNSRAPTNASELYGEFESSDSAMKSTGMTKLSFSSLMYFFTKGISSKSLNWHPLKGAPSLK